MASRGQVESGGLVYSCNCGWIDKGHLDPTAQSWRIGAAALWAQLLHERGPTASEQAFGRQSLSARETSPLAAASWELTTDTAFEVQYRQRSGQNVKGVWVASQGATGRYLVRYGLTTLEKKSVALAIFMEVSLKFEDHQSKSLTDWFTGSGFSGEDLVSNLIGFYIAVGEITLADVDTLCGTLSTAASLQIWDNDEQAGEHKNKTFDPRFAQNTRVELRSWRERLNASLAIFVSFRNDPGPSDPCLAYQRAFPEKLTSIVPAREGTLFKRLSLDSSTDVLPEGLRRK